MRKVLIVMGLLSAAIGYGSWPAHTLAAAPKPTSETVIVYYRAREGKQTELLKLLRKQWATLTALDLVARHGHLLYQGKDASGGAVFVEIFTWRNANTPDNPPAQVMSLWSAMQSLVEARGGHPGIGITAVKSVQDSK